MRNLIPIQHENKLNYGKYTCLTKCECQVKVSFIVKKHMYRSYTGVWCNKICNTVHTAVIPALWGLL